MRGRCVSTVVAFCFEDSARCSLALLRALHARRLQLRDSYADACAIRHARPHVGIGLSCAKGCNLRCRGRKTLPTVGHVPGGIETKGACSAWGSCSGALAVSEAAYKWSRQHDELRPHTYLPGAPHCRESHHRVFSFTFAL